MRRVFRHELVKRILLFSFSVLASAVVGLVSIPVLIESVGDHTWSLLAVIQVACQFFAILVGLGWGATGPSMVSGLPQSSRKAIFAESIRIRAVAFAILLPVAILTGIALTDLSAWTVVLGVLTYVSPGLNASWYLVGTNRPIPLFVFDAAPAILGQVAGLVAVVRFGSLEAYLVCTALFAITGVVGSAVYVLTRRADGPARGNSPPWRAILRTQVPGMAASIGGTAWTTLPTVLVRMIAPGSLPVFVMADRFLKFGALALAPVLQAIQGWIPEAGVESIRTRARQAILVAGTVGLAGGVALALLAPLGSSILSGGAVAIGLSIAVPLGLAFLFDSVSQVTGLAALVALRAGQALGVTAVLLLAVGLPIVAGLTAAFGIPGAVAGLAIASAGVATLRVSIALRQIRVP